MEKRRCALRVRRPSRATGRPRPKQRRQRRYDSPFGTTGFHQPPVPRRLPGQRATSRATAFVRAGAEGLGVNAHAGPERSSAGHGKWARPKTTLLRLGPVGTVFLRPIHPISAGIWGCGSACNAELPAQKPCQALRLDIVGL